ncbi:hypothetical protein tb265_22550 [Gemmatimonadetes bacterium T265]|nr:hypothetical protein tb265_22550 [Gemmatimonadetes bacterium T265]
MTPPAGGTSLVRRTSLRVGQRLFLALAPSLLAVVLVVALSYYGQIDRQAPLTLVWAAGALAVVSVVVTWRNTRYLASRIERLAGLTASPRAGAGHGGTDEFDRIEQTVDRLGTALSASEAERARTAAETEAKLVEQATLLAAVSAAAMRRMDEARLPLHILLDTQFGELTPNQEELLADARDAAEQAFEAVRRLRALADVDRGAIELRREWVSVDEVVHAVLPAVQAQARRRGGRVRTALEPALPRTVGDRTRLTAALALLLGDAAAELADGSEQAIATGADAAGVWVSVAPAPAGDDAVLARRLLEVQGARVDVADGALRLTLPRS